MLSISSNWRLKLLLLVSCTPLFCVPYFLIQNFPLFPVVQLPLSFLDRAIPFSEQWVWGYQSAYLLIFGVPLLLTRREDLMKWFYGYVFLCIWGFLILLFAPVSAPRPEVSFPEGMYAILLSYDGLVNCMPSLHAALAVFSAATAMHYVKLVSIWVVLSLWVLVIFYSTIATKQHYAVDLAPGALMGYVSYKFGVDCYRAK